MVRERIRGTLFGFFDFIRERGVAGFAIGFILGGAAQKLVQSLVEDIINPFLGIVGGTENLTEYVIGEFRVGNFISSVLNFFILCVIIYLIFKVLRLEKLDKPKV
jgi:large conductance mechanosensitive channel